MASGFQDDKLKQERKHDFRLLQRIPKRGIFFGHEGTHEEEEL